MNYAIDTNLLARLLHANHPAQPMVWQVLQTLLKRGETVCIFPQIFYELWVVATRPTTQNGLGLDAAQIGKEIAQLKSVLTLLPDIPPIYFAWEMLVTQHAVLGRNAHDTRIVAAMQVHGITHLLTFNTGDFKRYTGITVIAPDQVLNSPTTQTP